MDNNRRKVIDELEKFLEELNQNSGFFASMMINWDGRIMLARYNKIYEDTLEPIAAMAGEVFSLNKYVDFGLLNDFEFNYEEKKIIFTKLFNERPIVYFVVLLPPNIKGYKLTIKKTIKRIKDSFTHEKLFN